MKKLLKSMLLAAGIAGLMTGAVHAREESKQPSKPNAASSASGTSASGTSASGTSASGTSASGKSPAAATTAGAAASGSTAASKAAAQVDINSATEKELASLPKIGEVKSKAIVKNRPYQGKDDLVSKKILTQNEYDEIKDQIIAKQKPASGNKKN